MKKFIAALLLALYCFNFTSCISVNGEKNPWATAAVWGLVILALGGGGSAVESAGYSGGGGYDDGGYDNGGGGGSSGGRDYFSFRLNGFKVKLRKAR